MSDKSIFQKYIEWKTSNKSLGGYYDDLETAFEAGYELAQKEMESRLKEVREALEAAISAGEFFRMYADCENPYAFVCSCGFCKDKDSSHKLNKARAYLEKWK